MFLKGSMFRTAYYGAQAVALFVMLEQFGVYLNINITEFDE